MGTQNTMTGDGKFPALVFNPIPQYGWLTRRFLRREFGHGNKKPSSEERLIVHMASSVP